MRLNKYIASGTALSRRTADAAIAEGRVTLSGSVASQGDVVTSGDVVKLDGKVVNPRPLHMTIILNKPVGYVCSRNGQGSQTVFNLLPREYRHLQPVGRLDKDSSGLLLLTDDGDLANELTHPRYQKTKMYEVRLDKPLQPLHQQIITDHGVMLEDGLSQFMIEKIDTPAAQHEAKAELQGEGQGDEFISSPQRRGEPLLVTMHEGRNRQIRRTFAALGYKVRALHRTQFGPYALAGLMPGKIQQL